MNYEKTGMRILIYVAVAFAAFAITAMAINMKKGSGDVDPYGQDK